MNSLIQHFEADFLWKVNLKILNSGKILKTFTHDFHTQVKFQISLLVSKNILLIHVNFVCFVALCPKSTAMVMAGRSVHLTTLFSGQA